MLKDVLRALHCDLVRERSYPRKLLGRARADLSREKERAALAHHLSWQKKGHDQVAQDALTALRLGRRDDGGKGALAIDGRKAADALSRERHKVAIGFQHLHGHLRRGVLCEHTRQLFQLVHALGRVRLQERAGRAHCGVGQHPGLQHERLPRGRVLVEHKGSIHELLGQQALLLIVLQLVWKVEAPLWRTTKLGPETAVHGIVEALERGLRVSRASAQCNHVEHHNRDEHERRRLLQIRNVGANLRHLCRCCRDVVGIVMQQPRHLVVHPRDAPQQRGRHANQPDLRRAAGHAALLQRGLQFAERVHGLDVIRGGDCAFVCQFLVDDFYMAVLGTHGTVRGHRRLASRVVHRTPNPHTPQKDLLARGKI